MRGAVATLLGLLAKQPLHGPRVLLLLHKLLPPGLVGAIQVLPPRDSSTVQGTARFVRRTCPVVLPAGKLPSLA